MDVDTIEPGADFSEAVFRAVEACKVVLAIIGPGWLTASDGPRRAHNSGLGRGRSHAGPAASA